mmetsp:Transcript_27167/g.74697  ORF Transcript_27167/g.74697 Transcript_27167/m.74697 type:complete len:205 (+) Transcript_27167:499-1113(+)
MPSSSTAAAYAAKIAAFRFVRGSTPPTGPNCKLGMTKVQVKKVPPEPRPRCCVSDSAMPSLDSATFRGILCFFTSQPTKSSRAFAGSTTRLAVLASSPASCARLWRSSRDLGFSFGCSALQRAPGTTPDGSSKALGNPPISSLPAVGASAPSSSWLMPSCPLPLPPRPSWLPVPLAPLPLPPPLPPALPPPLPPPLLPPFSLRW